MLFVLNSLQTTPEQTENAVKAAIDAGYRHIDTAFVYGNEKEVGAAIKQKTDEGVVRREDMFVVSKVCSLASVVNSIFHAP